MPILFQYLLKLFLRSFLHIVAVFVGLFFLIDGIESVRRYSQKINFDWMDVGSFDDVHTVSPQDEDENSSVGEKNIVIDSRNVYVRNEEDKPIAVIGVDNVAVINTENGILVLHKDRSQKVKDAVAEVKKLQS